MFKIDLGYESYHYDYLTSSGGSIFFKKGSKSNSIIAVIVMSIAQWKMDFAGEVFESSSLCKLFNATTNALFVVRCDEIR